MAQRRHANIGFYVLAFTALGDQIAKMLVLDRMGDVQRTQPLTPFLNLVLVWNRGVTFGFLGRDEHHYMSYALIAVAAFILFLLGRWLWRTKSTLVAIALGLVMGGAIGNVVDRVRYGAVVDFLDFYYRDYHWYAFNVADAAIVTGVALLLLDGMVRGK